MAKGVFGGATISESFTGGTQQTGKDFAKELRKTKTKKEFLALVQSRYGKNNVSPDFVNKNDLAMIKKVVGTVAELEDKYPFMRGFVKFSSSISGNKQPTATMGSYGQLDINHSIWNINKNPALYSGKNRGVHPPNTTPESIIAHEFGHAIHNYLYTKMENYYHKKDKDKYYEVLVSRNSGSIIQKIEERAYKKIGLNTNKGRAQISLYAEMADSLGYHGAHEAFADAFADVFSNKKNASEASKALVNEVLREVKKWDKK